MQIILYEEEDVVDYKKSTKIESKECIDLFFVTFGSTYRLLHLGDIYREIYPLSGNVKKVMEDKMYEELLFLLDGLKRFIDTCELPPDISDKLNKIIEKFGYLEYINLVVDSSYLIDILYQILYRFYAKHEHIWTVPIR